MTQTATRWQGADGQLYKESQEGRQPVQVPVKELYSFRDFCEQYCGFAIVRDSAELDITGKHKFDWCRVNDKGEIVSVVKRTNPNAKWDWYTVGGRWDGYFKLKESVVSEANEEGDIADHKANIESQAMELLTKTLEGADITLISNQNEKQPKTSNCCLKRNIDIDGMCHETAEKAREYWRQCTEVIRGETWMSWEEVKRQPDFHNKIDHYHDFYWSQPPLVRLEEANLLPICNPRPDQLLGTTEEEYIDDVVNGAFAPYAFVKDSVWAAKGEMGHWGFSVDNMSRREWNKKFRKMFDALPGDTLLTLVDCHT